MKHMQAQFQSDDKSLTMFVQLLTQTLAIDQQMIAFLEEEVDSIHSQQSNLAESLKSQRLSNQLHQQYSLISLAVLLFNNIHLSLKNQFEELKNTYLLCLENAKYIPFLLKVFEALRLLSQEITKHNNLSMIKSSILEVSNYIDQVEMKIDQKYVSLIALIKWKIHSSVFMIAILSKTKIVSKEEIVKYIKSYIQLRKINLIPNSLAIKIFIFFIQELILMKNQHFIFFQLELQKLRKITFVEEGQYSNKQIMLKQEVDKTILGCRNYANMHIFNKIGEINNLTIDTKLGERKDKQSMHKQSKNHTRGLGYEMSNKTNKYLLRPDAFENTRIIQGSEDSKSNSSLRTMMHDHNQAILKNRKERIQQQLLFSRSCSANKIINSIHCSNSNSFAKNRFLGIKNKSPHNSMQETLTVNEPNHSRKLIVSEENHGNIQSQGRKHLNLNFSHTNTFFNNYKPTNDMHKAFQNTKRTKINRRKRKSLYDRVNQPTHKECVITIINLVDQMTLCNFDQEHCRITLAEILMDFQPERINIKSEKNNSFKGSQQDLEFDCISFTFMTTSRSQIAYFLLTYKYIEGKSYFKCEVITTDCPHQSQIYFGSNLIDCQRFQEIKSMVTKLHIYFEVIQQKIEREYTADQLEFKTNYLKQIFHLELSERQIFMILKIKEIIQYYFYWYYTKKIQINGIILQKREINFPENTTDFAVVLEEFKQDFKGYYKKLISSKNEVSIRQCFQFLSYGRLIFMKQIIKNTKNQYSFQVLLAHDNVYKSIKLRGKKSNFISKKFILQKYQIKTWSLQEEKYIKLSLILKKQECLIFLLKNILQNFLQKDKIHRILETLKKWYYVMTENIEQRVQVPIIIQNQKKQKESEQQFKCQELVNKNVINHVSWLPQYCQKYNFNENYIVRRTNHHLVKISNHFYLINEMLLESGLTLLSIQKVYHLTFHLLILHSNQATSTFNALKLIYQVQTPFYQKFALKINPIHLPRQYFHENQAITNLLRKNYPQKYVISQYISLIKTMLRWQNNKHQKMLVFIAIGKNLILNAYRIDLYFPAKQEIYSTYLQWNAEGNCDINNLKQQQLQRMRWKDQLKHIQIQIAETSMAEPPDSWTVSKINVQRKEYLLFRSYGKMSLCNKLRSENLQLIELDGQLHYLIIDYQNRLIKIGQPLSLSTQNVNIFSDVKLKTIKITFINNLFQKLANQFHNHKLSASQIQIQSFQFKSSSEDLK